MFTYKKLSDDVYSTAQIFPEQIDHIAETGFKTIICNRPDMEKPGQPFSDDIRKHAADKGIGYHYLPMSPGRLTPDLLKNMEKALKESPKPVLMHCASGTRSAMLWCFVNAKELGVDEVLERATKAGFNVAQIRPALLQYVQQA
ncbi:MAG TPA: TIGR01244 family phosphatase [Hellea balneolensis]|uniref:TIGR01244 family phosphatase n=1 Tax=Hellea balneolensis TaxID=287478 RepID=A0A7V5NXI9_9PROT|nr:TIGR01244 family phosphatase [Hellea balneolensis]